MTATNPFFNRGCIEEPSCFFGRQRELQDIFNLLGKPIPQSVSIVGQRKIGKSSLLQHIMRPQTVRQYIPEPDNLILVCVNFEGLAYFSEMECLQKLLWDGYAAVATLLPQPGDGPKIDGSAATPFLIIESLNRLFRWLRQQKKRLVFLFDEFELSCGNPNLTSSFFNTLRSFSTSFGVAYVVATMQELWRLPHSKGARSSPFFNYFTTVYVGLFTGREAQDLLATLSPRLAGPEEAAFLLEEAGLFPFFLQLLGWYLWDQEARSGKIGSADRQAALVEFKSQAAPHFAFFWNHLSDQERSVLSRLARQAALEGPDTTVAERLRQQSLLFHDKLFCSAFAAFVNDQTV
ncbi:MAG TPA: ATP-binding protein [Candidatus Xenobia bacterium]